MKFGVTATTFNLTATDAAGNSSGAPHSQAPAGSALATNAAAPTSGNESNAFVFSNGIGTNTPANHSMDAFQPSHDPFASAAAAIEASFATLVTHAFPGAEIAIGAEAAALNTVLSHAAVNNFHLV